MGGCEIDFVPGEHAEGDGDGSELAAAGEELGGRAAAAPSEAVVEADGRRDGQHEAEDGVVAPLKQPPACCHDEVWHETERRCISPGRFYMRPPQRAAHSGDSSDC